MKNDGEDDEDGGCMGRGAHLGFLIYGLYWPNKSSSRPRMNTTHMLAGRGEIFLFSSFFYKQYHILLKFCRRRTDEVHLGLNIMGNGQQIGLEA